ncbi:MAG: hypothetical protein AB1446_11075 [Bacillota bacterium]
MGAALAYLFLGKKLTSAQLVAGIAVVAGVWLSTAVPRCGRRFGLPGAQGSRNRVAM